MINLISVSLFNLSKATKGIFRKKALKNVTENNSFTLENELKSGK